AWGPRLAGFDAAGGETPWTATELPGPDGTCPAGSHEIMPRGDGEAVLLGFCGSEGERPFTGLLDTATGEVSEQRALPAGAEKDGSDTLRLGAADPVVVYTFPHLEHVRRLPAERRAAGGRGRRLDPDRRVGRGRGGRGEEGVGAGPPRRPVHRRRRRALRGDRGHLGEPDRRLRPGPRR